jgi:hypothetical protein
LEGKEGRGKGKEREGEEGRREGEGEEGEEERREGDERTEVLCSWSMLENSEKFKEKISKFSVNGFHLYIHTKRGKEEQERGRMREI